ncbi:ABC transporter permease [Leucobacter sp. CSA1]|uniref:ABC transporter permease n=1 Tax=Leucobacter chromiisoli TaxID=2796471 RepID=A0A934Q3P9_9MICO|nr:ABC transporter permease [Leucobacter chromiisoli]MBK0417885.1 ABC transporter permease [Leucobacter chromiisoli]
MTTNTLPAASRPQTKPIEILHLGRTVRPTTTVLLRLAAIALFAGLWEIGARSADSILIPTFSDTMVGLFDMMFVTGELWPALGVSNLALVIGYATAVVIAVPLGLAMARWQAVDRLLSPITAATIALPISPLIPIILVAFGLGMLPKVLVIVLFAWVYILTNVRAGVRTVPRTLSEMARSFGAGEGRVWARILIPGAVPAIFSGLRIGLSRAFAGMVIVELIMLPVGIGQSMLDYRGTFQSDLLYATTIAVVLEAVLLATLMQTFERRLMKWKK